MWFNIINFILLGITAKSLYNKTDNFFHILKPKGEDPLDKDIYTIWGYYAVCLGSYTVL